MNSTDAGRQLIYTSWSYQSGNADAREKRMRRAPEATAASATLISAIGHLAELPRKHLGGYGGSNGNFALVGRGRCKPEGGCELVEGDGETLVEAVEQ